MKIFLLGSGSAKRSVTPPFAGSDHAVADGACPNCSADPFKVAGHSPRPSHDDRAWEADALCLACRAPVGTLRAEPDTLFGVREDEAVLKRSRCRVY